MWMRLVKSSLLLAAVMAGNAALAAENRYDLFARALAPAIALFAKDTQNDGSALSLELTLQSVKKEGLPSAFTELVAGKTGAPGTIKVVLQPPDRMLLEIPFQGMALRLCRDRQQIWAAPKPVMEALAVSTGYDLNAPKKRGAQLAPLRLPYSKKQLVLLPALFQVEDAGESPEGRVLEVRLLAEAGQAAGQWRMLLTIGAEGKPVRFKLTGPDTELDLQIGRFEISKVSPEIWAGGEVVHLEAAQFIELFEKATPRP